MNATEAGNPFRRWFNNQPLAEVTQYTLAKDLGVDQSYVSDLMSERNTTLPSLSVAVRIEDATGGRVKPRDIYHFAMENRAAKEAAVRADA